LKITGPIEDHATPVRATPPDGVRGPLKRVMLAVAARSVSLGHGSRRAASLRSSP
jgi:hypothetical protein